MLRIGLVLEVSMSKKSDQKPRVTCSVPEAGERLGTGRNSAYAAARRGEIPTIRIGKLIRVPEAILARMLGGEPS
jgi:excisionase family DNA binding protein